jgi:hypothetical protein
MIRFSIDQASVRGFRGRLVEFSKGTGKTIQEAMNLLGKGCAKELASLVPPYGISAKQGAAFQKSIAKQVDRAVRHANVAGTKGSARLVHEQVRRKGQVPKGLKTQGQYKRDPVPIGDKIDLLRQKQMAAGTAKGAWIAAGEAIDGKKMRGISKWIRRHAKRNGFASIKAEGIGSVISLTNRLPYINALQPQSTIDTALKRGYARNFRHMTIVVKKIRGEI